MISDVLQRLAAMPARLATIVNGLDEEHMDARPPGGGLSIRETLALLADLELNVRWTAQAARVLRDRAPVLAAVEPDVRAFEHGYRHQDPRVALGTYTMARKHLLAMLAPLADAEWERTATTGDGAVITLAAWAKRLADEDEGHLRAIESNA